MTDEKEFELLIILMISKGTLKWRKAGMPEVLAKAVAIHELVSLFADLVEAQSND